MVHRIMVACILLVLSCSRCAAHYEKCTNGTVSYIGDGYCDNENNNELCDYDGGDCCECSCVDGDYYECGYVGYACVDPACPDEANTSTPNCTGSLFSISDGLCDPENNNESCDYDGGDCCECTCVDGEYYECGSFTGFDCLDPACADPNVVGQFPNCAGILATIGDGLCTGENNNPLCGYDGGDCCMCTCIDSSGIACDLDSLICLDPDAHNEIHDCNKPPPNALPCSAGVQRTWVVETSAQARALAVAVNCSGGSFEAEWKGNIVVDQAIYVVDGTVLDVTGVGSSAGISGNLDTRLFVVVNASLHLKDIILSNGVGIAGGAIFALRSSLTFSSTVFSDNNARGNGGALYVSDGSNVSFRGETYVFGNHAAGDGGALYVSDSSVVLESGKASFSENSALNGGAFYVNLNAFVFLNGNASFEKNIADYVVDAVVSKVGFGGAIYASRSAIMWSGHVYVAGNNASFVGGGLYMDKTNASWGGEAVLVNNGAYAGGAIYLERADISWNGKAELANNSGDVGGALAVYDARILWDGEAQFVNNSADSGGALYVQNSNVLWNGEAEFFHNRADTGGALHLEYSASVFWNGNTKFVENFATGFGGGLYAGSWSNVSWSGDATFFGNSATGGGAIYNVVGSTVGWSGNTKFISNRADVDGGAVQSFPSLSMSNFTQYEVYSFFVIRGTTSFVNNSCGANGGAMALLGGLSVTFETTRVTFIGNSAQVAGGAVFVTDSGIGLVFAAIAFVSNSAQVGGAVYASASGNTKSSSYDVQTTNPTTFEGCHFIGNRATATGGAIESAAGQDAIINTSFVGNIAGVGGALRLAGTAYMSNCSFEENLSDVDGGAAVSNIGYLSSMAHISFVGNVFNCSSEMFLDYYEAVDLYKVVCHGCETRCQSCSFDTEGWAPTCTKVMKHSSSPGGTVTLEMVSIDRGHWRATNSSRNVLACYNANACRGGVTESEYCIQGYEGPYCSVCSSGYAATLGFACRKCSNSIGGIVLAATLLATTLLAAGVMVLYLMSAEQEGTRRGAVDYPKQYIPLQSLKIVIVAWQILTQFTAVTNVTYPDVYQRFLDGVDVLNFNVCWVFSAGCIADVDFHDNLLIATIGPIVVIAFLGATYAVALRKYRQNDEAIRTVRHKHVSTVLLLTFLVYSSVSSILFQMFACEQLDDGKNYLRADYRIECDSYKHRGLQIYAGVMMCLYTVSIPAAYASLLFRDRNVLKTDGATRHDTSRTSSFANLWKPYRPSAYYYEVIECGRRIVLAGAVVFIYPNTAAQIAVSLVTAFAFVIVSEGLAPYASQWDTWINRMGQVVVFISMYVALLLKVDVSKERDSSQHVFEVVLVAAHACMLLAIVVESVVMACSLRKQEREDPSPRRGGAGSSRHTTVSTMNLASATEDFPFPDGILEAQTVAMAGERKAALQ